MAEFYNNGPTEEFPQDDNADQRVNFVFQDQRILDEACNLACGYCAPSGFPMRIDREQNANMPEAWRGDLKLLPIVDAMMPDKPKVADFFDIGRTVIAGMQEQAGVEILKLSGGEITLHSGLVDYVREVHQDYTAVQILTNGIKLTTEQIDAFGGMGNIYFQVSLDGTRPETNRARTPNARLTERVVANMRRISEHGMPIEINCVLTNRNTGEFSTMLDDLRGVGDIIVIPRPVRGGAKELMNCTPDQLATFKTTVLDRYAEYADLLPPKVYLERLVTMMEVGARTDRCYVPFFVQGVDNYGNCETCSCGGTLPLLGNVLDNPDEVFDKHRQEENYDPGADYDDCNYCMTQFELFNLFIEGSIS